MPRMKCLDSTWKFVNGKSIKDPELTKNKFYRLTERNVQVMTKESMVSLVGDSGEEITRPKHLFKIFK
jgi:hypothetical protein